MANYTLPCEPGDTIATANAGNAGVIAALLGKTYVKDGKTYRFVKTAAALTSMGRRAYVSAQSGGLPTYAINTTTTANDYTVIGGAVADQADTASGDGLLLQIGGFGELRSAGAIAAGAPVGTSTTAGEVDDATITEGGSMAVALESAAGADESVGVRFINLI